MGEGAKFNIPLKNHRLTLDSKQGVKLKQVHAEKMLSFFFLVNKIHILFRLK